MQKVLNKEKYKIFKLKNDINLHNKAINETAIPTEQHADKNTRMTNNKETFQRKSVAKENAKGKQMEAPEGADTMKSMIATSDSRNSTDAKTKTKENSNLKSLINVNIDNKNENEQSMIEKKIYKLLQLNKEIFDED